jgi:hypothetical protein
MASLTFAHGEISKTRDTMRAAGAGRAGAYRQPAGELGPAGCGEGCSFLVADADPFDFASADGIGERIERVADQSEDMFDPNLLENTNEHVCDRFGHRHLTRPCCLRTLSRRRAP